MKPTKKQQAIIDLLDIIDTEGLWYGVCNYGVEEEVEDSKDKKLALLVAEFYTASEELENYLDELRQEVEPFLPDYDE